jgi:hypothetical protein
MTSRGAAGYLWSQVTTFYEEGIQKLVPRYDKYLNGGSYVKKVVQGMASLIKVTYFESKFYFFNSLTVLTFRICLVHMNPYYVVTRYIDGSF